MTAHSIGDCCRDTDRDARCANPAAWDRSVAAAALRYDALISDPGEARSIAIRDDQAVIGRHGKVVEVAEIEVFGPPGI